MTEGTHQNQDLELYELWQALYRERWITIVFTGLFAIFSVVYALSLPNKYKSTAVLAPSIQSGNAFASLGGQLGGLASLAGLSAGNSSDKAVEAIAILTSWAFIEEFIEEHDIAPDIIAAKGWDSEKDKLVYDENIYDTKTKTWIAEDGSDEDPEPSSWELYVAFSGMLSASKDDKTGFIKVSVESLSPSNSKYWVDELLKKINATLKLRDREKALANLEFLNGQIAETEITGVQAVLYNLVEEQTKALMLASGQKDYVFRVVNAPRVAEIKSSPARSVICVAITLLGMVLGFIISLIRYKYKGRKSYGKN